MRSPEGVFALFFKKHWGEVIVGALLIPLLWQIFGLNREVGELKTQLQEQQAHTQRLEQQLDKANDHLTSEIEKLHDRVDQERPVKK